MERGKGTQFQPRSYPGSLLHPLGQDCPLLLRENSILEGVGDQWGLGFAPVAPLTYPFSPLFIYLLG